MYRLIAETAEAPLSPPPSLPAFSQTSFPTAYHPQTPSAGDKDTLERNQEKNKPEKELFCQGREWREKELKENFNQILGNMMGRKNTTKKEGRFEKIVERTWGGEYKKQYIDDML